MDAAKTLADKIFSFVKLLKECADKLDKLADEMEETQKNVTVAKVVGSSVSVGGAAAMTAAGIATIFTGGAALPVIATLGGAASWLGFATNTTSDVVNAVTAKLTLKEAENVVDKIQNLHQEMEELMELLKKEAQKKGGQDGSCSDDYLIELILRGMAKHNELILDDCVNLKEILENHCYQSLKTAVRSVLSLVVLTAVTIIGTSVARVLAKIGGKAARGVAKSAAGKTAGKAVGRLAGGAFGLALSIPELVDSCKNLKSSETEASKSLKENAEAIRTESEKMKEDLQEIVNAFRRLARVKECIGNKSRSRDDMKILIDFATGLCTPELIRQWLKENSNSEAFFKLVDMFVDMLQFLKEKIDEEEKKNHSNTVDITFVAHGAIIDSMIPASCLLPLPKITDVVLYSPWNCVIDAKVAYGVATGRIEPQHRVFYCRKGKGCEIPDTEHKPPKLPNEWNSMKKAGLRKIPVIMLSPLRPPKDGYWERFEILENQHGKPGRNRIVVPFILPRKSEESPLVPFFVVTLALSVVLFFSRFQATLHLTACLGKLYRKMKLDEDALKEQYACTIDNTVMTSSEDMLQQQTNELFRALKAVFG